MIYDTTFGLRPLTEEESKLCNGCRYSTDNGALFCLKLTNNKVLIDQEIEDYLKACPQNDLNLPIQDNCPGILSLVN